MTAIAQFLSSSKEMSNLLPFGYSIQEVIKEKGEKRLDWKVIENNQLFTEQLALKKTDTLGSKLFSKHELEKEYVECLSEAQTASTPVQRIFSLDNKRKWIQADFISNQVGQIVTFTKDISSTINEKLMYSDILSSISDAVFIVNEKGELQFICPNVATIFGFSSAEVQSMGNVSKVFGSPILKLIKQVTDREISNESLSILDKRKSKHDLLVNLKQVDLFGGSILITCRDVTDKVKFELAHNENSILLHTIIDTLSDLVWLKDSDGRYIMCNREFEKFFNVEEKDLVGKTDYDFVEKELADFFRKNDREVLKLNGPRMNEEELFYQDGSGKHIIAETIKSPFYDRDGSLTGVLGIARDITDRVRESSRFKGLFDQSPNGIMLLDTTGKIIDVNQKMVALLGGTRKQLIHKKSLDFTHEEDREIAKQKIDDLVEGNNEGLSFTKRFLSVEGKEITAQVSISLMKDPFFDGGVAVLKQVQDISSIILLNKERDDFQLRYKRLLETSHDFIVIIDHTGKFVEANPAAINLTGFEQSEFKKMHIWDLDNLHDQESTVEVLKKIQSGEARSIETSIKTKSGGSLDIEMVLSPIPLESQNWKLIIGKDITERKKKERQLEVAISDLERSQQIANIGSWHLDVKKDELTWSDGVYRIFGTEPRSFEGTVEAFYSFVHPEERDDVIATFNNCVEKRLPYAITHRIITKTGEVRWVEERADIQYDENGMASAHGTVQDITKEIRTMADLNQQVQKMNLALNSGGVVAWETDATTNSTLVFPERASLGFAGVDFYSLESIASSIKKEQQKKFIDASKGFESGLVDNFSCDVQIESHDGVWKWYDVRVTVLETDDHNKPAKYFGTLENIEEKKNIERLQIISQEEERARVSREVHDSIGQMLAATRMILNRTLAKDIPMEKMKETNQYIDEMLADLIKETRFIINNYGVSILNNTSLKESMEDLADKMQKVYEGKISINWLGKDNVLDFKQSFNIFRIYQEAITNAIKYSQAENINVLITNKNNFEMQVFDDGEGFDVEMSSQGFGLKNMNERAAQINGSLFLDSTPGDGTVVKLTLN